MAGFLHQGRFIKKGTHANGTIACDGQRLFIAFLNADNVIASAVDLNGKIIWQREVGKFVSKFGYAPSPVLYKSLVIFAADNSGGGYIAALDGQTGEIACASNGTTSAPTPVPRSPRWAAATSC